MAGVAVFLLVVVLLLAGIHGYLYRRLVHNTAASRRLRRLGLAAAAALALLLPATLVLGRALDPATARWIAWPGYVWLALMFYLLVVLLLLELPLLVVRLVTRSRPAPAAWGAEAPGAAPAPAAVESPAKTRQQLGRRLVLARGGALVAGAVAVGLTGYGMTSALGAPRVTRVTLPLRRLGTGLDGLRVAVVSDIHLGPTLGRRHTERIVETINEQSPDLVAVVGDLVDGTVAELGDDAAPLADLVSRHGSFFVTGNHEYYSGSGPWLVEFERLGLRPLRNERVEIRRGGAVLDLAGVNDPNGVEEGDGPDFDAALDGRDPDRPVVLLAHQPVQVHEAASRGVDLQLSGHTHGGQLYPFHYLIRLDQPVVAGLHRFGDTQLYVTNGAGFWGPPVRVGAPPEIVMVELTSAPP
ncbi:MAG TPA: metallophosphoesterase [Pseudonocardiaceae bacterium]|nr:metallophosphoesterase [Pseudonocardiaceae bacterium]